MIPAQRLELRTEWLGRLDYDAAHVRQVESREQVACGAAPPTLLLLEHEPVVTFGRREASSDLLVTNAELSRRGIELRLTERGGRATFHGPGQLVAYFLAPVRKLAPDVPTFVWRLEETLRLTVAQSGVTAKRDSRNRGLWVGDAKLAAVGIAVRAGISWHGVALNINPDLEAFGLIRPCGLDTEVTSLARLAPPPPAVAMVASAFAQHLADVFGLALVEAVGG